MSFPGETVSATWGEELFTPRQYNSYRVGPFSGTTQVRRGETRAEAMARLYRELGEFAAAAREEKRASFAAALARAEKS